MKKICLFLGAFAASVFLCGKEITLTEKGKTAYRIVLPNQKVRGDLFVAKELQKHLKSATGADFRIVRKKNAPPGNRIFLGIPSPGTDLKSFAEQEHAVKSVGKDLYLFGKGPNGSRYAVYDLLQNVMGFRFFDARGGIRFRKTPTLKLPELNRRKQFSFAVRRTTMYWHFNQPHAITFLYRNGQNNWVKPIFDDLGTEVAGDDFFHHYPLGHTLGHYLPPFPSHHSYPTIPKDQRNLWKTHPEYFTLKPNQKRTPHEQYCLSNPDLRKLLTKRVFANMEKYPDRHSFDISVNDTPGRLCHCRNCAALEKKYGVTGGPLFDFLIEFCRIAEKKYPGKLITTLVYRKKQTQKPPVNITKFPDNFAPVFAPIDDNFAKDWTHPDNKETYEDLKKWGGMCKHLLVWYYPNPYLFHTTPPLGNVERLVNDIRLMKKAGVTGMIWEHDQCVPEMLGFTELQSFVALQLFQDVNRDWKKLAREFIDFEYGKAADGVWKYWQELESLRKSEKLYLVWNASFLRFTYLTPERMVRWNKLFDTLEKAVAKDPVRLFNVQRLRYNLDLHMLRRYTLIKEAYPQFSLSPEAIIKRLRSTHSQCLKEFFGKMDSRRKQRRRGLDNAIFSAMLRLKKSPKPLPKEIFGKIPPNRLYITMPYVNQAQYVNDKDGAFGIVAVHSKPVPKLPMRSHMDDHSIKKFHWNLGRITARDLGPRGQYKIYKMGRITLTPDCEFRVGVGDWWDLKTRLDEAYVMGSHNRADIYVSLKFQGPNFYKEDAGRKNLVFCDRLIVVRLD